MDLGRVAESMVELGPQKTEGSSRRIRVLFGSHYIFDTVDALYVWEHPRYPQYYLPRSALQHATLESPEEYEGYTIYSVATVGRVAKRAAAVVQKGPLEGLVRLQFGDMDQWFEEDEPIYVHPMDPYKRVDTRRSTRTVRIEHEGTVLAESSAAIFLYETSLPVRYYLPQTSVDWSLLRPSDLRTRCPYKGEARYFDVVINHHVLSDLVWWYPAAHRDAAAVEKMVCFYNERVDIFIDGKKMQRPRTAFA